MKPIKSTRYVTIGMRVAVVLSLLITAGQSFAQKVGVDFITKKYIWRGTATNAISSKPDKNAKAIDKAAKKMFEKFPPQGRG